MQDRSGQMGIPAVGINQEEGVCADQRYQLWKSGLIRSVHVKKKKAAQRQPETRKSLC